MRENIVALPKQFARSHPRQANSISRSDPASVPQPSALPSLQKILNLPAFKDAELVYGRTQVNQPVTWVHVAEIMDVRRFLAGGELLLSTGMELVRVTAAARHVYIQGLAKAGVRALALELVQWITEVPQDVLDSAEEFDFPIVVFRSEVSFRELTRAAHQEILRPEPPHRPESTMQMILKSLAVTGYDRSFIHSELGPLLALPPRPRATLLVTLETLLDAQFNIAEAARKLGVRRQSIYYRLDQLTELLGSLEDPSKKLGFLVAFSLLRRSQTPFIVTERPVSPAARNAKQ
jgi:hypothetical protein